MNRNKYLIKDYGSNAVLKLNVKAENSKLDSLDGSVDRWSLEKRVGDNHSKSK